MSDTDKTSEDKITSQVISNDPFQYKQNIY